MINRKNWLAVQAYLTFQEEVRQSHPLSGRAQWGRLRHLLEWADERPLWQAPRFRPTFPSFAESLTSERGGLYSASYLSSLFKTCRSFFNWARQEYPASYGKIEGNWVASLRPSRARSEQSELQTRELYTLEDVRRLVAVPAASTAQRRLRAAVAFLFLSGMRIGAFVTLPLACVEVGEMRVLQLPARGVRTKNSKAAVTYLLNIPDLLEIVREWDREIRSQMPPTAYWYAHLTTYGELTAEMPKGDRIQKRHDFRDDLVDLCVRAGIPYRSPHKFRHGHAVYALKKARTVPQLKAISQNLMHSNMGVTDGIYGKLVDEDVRDFIASLGE